MRQRRIVIPLALLIVLGAGLLAYIVGTNTSSFVHTIDMATMPWVVAVDPGTGHAFVVNHSEPGASFGASGNSFRTRSGLFGFFPSSSSKASGQNGTATGSYGSYSGPFGSSGSSSYGGSGQGYGGFFGGGGSASMLDTGSGTVLNTAPVGPDPRAIAVDKRTGHVFVANDDDASVSVIDSHTGAFLGAVPVGPQPRALAVDSQLGHAFVVNAGLGAVTMLDMRTGQQLSSQRVGTSSFQASAAIDTVRHRVFIGGATTISVLDAHSGALVKTIDADGSIDHLALDSRTGLLFIAGQDGLRILDEKTNQVRHFGSLGAIPLAVAVDSQRGRVFVTHDDPASNTANAYSTGSTSPGIVSVLDEHSGAILQTYSVGVAPVSIAVDEVTGRAVVVNAGGSLPVRDAWSIVPPSLQGWVPQSLQPQAGTSTRDVPGSISVMNAAG